VKLVFVETPSNPSLDVVDIEALAARVHAAGALLAVDNTTATVLSQAPLALGADFSVASDTKAFNGHSDVVFGHVAVRDADAARRRAAVAHAGRRDSRADGGVARAPRPRDARPAPRRGRPRTRSRSPGCSPRTRRSRWCAIPGLESDPSHEIARRPDALLRRRRRLRARRRGDRAALPRDVPALFEATSFGGVHSSAERRVPLGHRQGRRGFIRLSVGVEATADLVAAIAGALDRL
jgi:cystathionine gamma-lyase